MKNSQQNAHVFRGDNRDLPADEEVEDVNTAKTTERFSESDEYLDLEQLVQGVCWAQGS
jgi:hypothetical protein